jgi:hypothetical protein
MTKQLSPRPSFNKVGQIHPSQAGFWLLPTSLITPELTEYKAIVRDIRGNRFITLRIETIISLEAFNKLLDRWFRRIHRGLTGGRALLGREGFLNDPKPTMHEARKLVNNDRIDQVELKKQSRLRATGAEASSGTSDPHLEAALDGNIPPSHHIPCSCEPGLAVSSHLGQPMTLSKRAVSKRSITQSSWETSLQCIATSLTGLSLLSDS